jgi:surface carbohydrate biosynthesis protein (TIGR04326 family)
LLLGQDRITEIPSAWEDLWIFAGAGITGDVLISEDQQGHRETCFHFGSIVKSLIVFDGNVSFHKILRYLPVGQSVDLFSLSGDWGEIDRAKAVCDATGRSVQILDAARGVDAAVETLRGRLGPWSEELGYRSVAGRSLQEWLMAPGGETSAWWFTLLSEKNPLKTDVFLKIAQLNAMDALLSSRDYGFCLVASTDRDWGKAVVSAAVRHSVSVRRLDSSGPPGWRARGKAFLRRAGPWGDFSMGLVRLGSFVVRGARARWVMGALPKRKRHPLSLLFVTYFPVINRSAAEKGEFLNRFSGPLQDLLRGQGRQVNWLLMAAPYDGFGFGAALKMGQFFAKAGEAIFFLEEFFGPKQMWACVRSWAKLMWVYTRIKRSIEAGFWSDGLAVPEADPLLARLWRRSTLGDVGVEGGGLSRVFQGGL